MPKINILDKHTAELIAAGEVVERPSSVVKELMENSVDAGAAAVTVEIQNGGITYIRITDDGCGISREDVPKSFMRHATSKISDESDLDSISSLGFRGEALASVAAVARVDLLTCVENETGTRYIIEGGEERLCDDAGCPQGTTIVVRDLFFNTPARMKYLKKNVSEGNAVADVVDRISLSHPEISFRFIRDGKQVMMTPGDGKLLSALSAVYGRAFAAGLIPAQSSEDGIQISGYISKPSASRASRSMQLVFLNGRFVKSGTVSAALSEGYKNSLMTGKFPACALNINMPFDLVDVNVHPAKIEVRFADERPLFRAVYYAVKNALSAGDTRPEFVMPTVPHAVPQPAVTEVPRQQRFADNASVHPAAPEITASLRFLKETAESAKEIPNPQPEFNSRMVTAYQPVVYPVVEKNDPSDQQPEKTASTDEKIEPAVPEYSLLGEAFHTYIIAEVGSELYIIDKHAAHERILYNRITVDSLNKNSQMLLSPVPVVLRKDEYTVLLEHRDELQNAGFLFDSFGTDTIVVRGIPMILDGEQVSSLMEEIADKLKKGQDFTPDKLDWLYHSVACRAAVKGGDITSDKDLSALIAEIVQGNQILYCPHGRPVAMRITKSELEKQFKRT